MVCRWLQVCLAAPGGAPGEMGVMGGEGVKGDVGVMGALQREKADGTLVVIRTLFHTKK